MLSLLFSCCTLASDNNCAAKIPRYACSLRVAFLPAASDHNWERFSRPHFNGFQLYQEVKKKDNNVRACFITAYEVIYENLKEDYPTLDVGCFIKKPVETDNLVKKIRKELKC
jgi:hypothetical protein